MARADVDAAQGRKSSAQRYGDLYAALSAADRETPLEPEDVERLAIAAHLTGRDAESADLFARAHLQFLARGNPGRASRAAFWLAFTLTHAGERARAAGWIARARRLLDQCGQDCVERGYLMLPVALQAVADGDLATAESTFTTAATIGDRFADPDLANLARQGAGRSLVNRGDLVRGAALLDEVMVAVTSGEVSPLVAGTIYCSVIEACFEMLDVRRAREWTDALARWCASQPDMVAYRGHCLVRRAEIRQMQGAWPDAIDEARQACDLLSRPTASRANLGGACYQLAELYRLRGEFRQAEQEYRRASELGRTPQPGLALLRLAEGRIDAAKASICRAVEETRDRRSRPAVLAACVEILVAASDVAGARRAADELRGMADSLDTPYPRALGCHADGAVLLAEGDAGSAVGRLREACSTWRDLDAPYEAARAAVLVGSACRALGDADGAQMEFEAAGKTFAQLGAASDLARLQSLSPTARSGDSPLTAREIEVLRLVATGKTNREIAGTLTISEKTVARHLSNIFTKLDLSSRAAATAYAFQHRLV